MQQDFIFRYNLFETDTENYVSECYKDENFQKVFDEVKETLDQVPAQEPYPEYPIFTFLGTGSCIPNKTRNTSGILVQIR